MDQAYEIKALGEKIVEKAKADGLEIAEQAVEKIAKAAYMGLKEWAKESSAISDTKIDDFVMPALDYLDGFMLPQIEKIDLDGDGK